MAFKLLADHFSITRDSNHFIQLKTLKNPKVSDEVWVAFSVEGDSKFARATVQDLMDTFEETFFNHLEIKPYERFESALREVNLIYNNIRHKKGPAAVGRLSGLIAVFSGTELHLTQCNEAEAYLIRKEKLSHISEGLASRGEDLFVNIASGELMPEDKVIFCTARLLRHMSHTQLVNSCRNGVTEAIDAIREYMMEAGDSSLGVSCVHVQVPYRGRGEAALPVSGWLGKVEALWDKVLALAGRKGGGESGAGEGQGGGVNDPMRRNTLLAAILGIVLILIISISVLLESSRNRALREEYRDKIEALEADINTATTKGYGNEKESANAILDQVEKEAKTILEEDLYRDEVLAILEELKRTRDDINNTLRLSEPSAYADLSQKTPEVSAVGLTALDDNLFAFDRNQVYKIVINQVLDPKAVSGSDVLIHGANMEDLGNLVFLTQGGQVVEYNGDSFNSVNTQDESWKKGVDVAAFGRFFYILNPDDNQIYRYSRGNSSYSVATNYNTDAELEGAVSLAIDGSIYVLKEGGEIIKLFRGEVENFKVEDLAVDISEANEIFTAAELNHIYVLDSANQRVVVLQKEEGLGARYRGLVQFEIEDTQLKGLYVNKSEDSLYVLGEKAVYKADLKELDLK